MTSVVRRRIRRRENRQDIGEKEAGDVGKKETKQTGR